MSVVSETIAFYKKKKEEEKQYKKLVRKNLDYAFLERIVEQCDNNPGLTVTITLADHTKLEITTKKKAPSMTMEQLFNGEE